VIATSTDWPGYALVVDETLDPPAIITVLFDHPEEYVREGSSFRSVGTP
jgi:hypothetical protein